MLFPKILSGMANSVDPDQIDQTAPEEAVWSRSTLFANTILSVPFV